MLQLRIPKIYGGSSRCVKHTLAKHALHTNSRGVWGHAPRKFLKIRCQEIEFGGIFSGFSC